MSQRKRQQVHDPDELFYCRCSHCQKSAGSMFARIDAFKSRTVYYNWWQSVRTSKP